MKTHKNNKFIKGLPFLVNYIKERSFAEAIDFIGMPYFGCYIKALRIARGYTQEQLADTAVLGRWQLSKIETGAELPQMIILYRLSNILNVDLIKFYIENK